MDKQTINKVVKALKKYEGKPLLLDIPQEKLQELLFENNDFREELLEVITKIDFSNVNFDGFKAAGKDFSQLTGVKLNPQNLHDKDLRKTVCAGVVFTGGFDDVKVTYTNFTNSIGAVINPQTILHKNMLGSVCSCVEFTGGFDDACVIDTSFKDSIGAKIDPQEVFLKQLTGTVCENVEFIGHFKGVDIVGTNFKGSENAKINLQEVDYRHTDFCDTYLTGVIDDLETYRDSSFVGSNYEEVINFRELSRTEKNKLSMDELCAYYRRQRKYAVVTNKEIEGVESKRRFHPLITAAMLVRRLSNGQSLRVFKNGISPTESIRTQAEKILNRNTIPISDIIPEDTTRPVIFSITHTGKFDIEIVNEAIKSAYYLLSDDEEYMHRTIDGFFTEKNGVVYVDNDYPEDAHVAKETNKKILQKGGYIMWYPERIWNLSPNQMILYCKTGIIETAYETDALILPIGIDQKGKDFLINIGDFVDPRNFKTENGILTKQNKIAEVDRLRDTMATLKYQLWEKDPVKFDQIVEEYLEKYPNAERSQITEDYYEKFVEERIAEWPFITKEDIDNMVFKPKTIVTEEEVFAPIRNIKQDTCFAEKVKIKVLINS